MVGKEVESGMEGRVVSFSGKGGRKCGLVSSQSSALVQRTNSIRLTVVTVGECLLVMPLWRTLAVRFGIK